MEIVVIQLGLLVSLSFITASPKTNILCTTAYEKYCQIWNSLILQIEFLIEMGTRYLYMILDRSVIYDYTRTYYKETGETVMRFTKNSCDVFCKGLQREYITEKIFTKNATNRFVSKKIGYRVIESPLAQIRDNLQIIEPLVLFTNPGAFKERFTGIIDGMKVNISMVKKRRKKSTEKDFFNSVKTN